MNNSQVYGFIISLVSKQSKPSAILWHSLSLSSAISLLHNSLAKANREDEINQIEDSIVNNFRLDNNFQMICWSGFNMSETSQNFLLRYALL